ncbi:cysteine-rich CWC family protein [Pseudomaricurvus alkylphenolicus]|uniref:cysteine-rich CWC family protein n=1 Tax=Pseudomaricurvus alkylphenolicus TaxID=1306991 RepID=UPI0014208100|nr:cysteine-rich CWC family protein [Pseudomaricurvus alkylphenolicus]NIB44518.1 cysteine-rich CWC family protein [Pseudomaricurvus alkylphenolicus]
MNEPKAKASSCPLCGGDNECGNLAPTAGDADFYCWCMDESIDPAMLENLPPESRGKRCVCRACVLSYTPVKSC